MFEREEAERLAKLVLSAAPAGTQAEVIIFSKNAGNTRFSSNAISQHMDEATSGVRLRLIKDGKQGVATGNSFEPSAIQSLVRRASVACEHSAPDPELLPLIDKQPHYTTVEAFNRDTFNATPRMRAERILEQVTLCRQRSLEAAGLFTTGGSSLTYAASTGVFAHHRSSVASFSMSVFADGGKVEGAADSVDHNINSLSVRRVGSRAIEKAMNGRGAKPIDAGKYDVVLEPGAVSDLMLFLTWLGFSAQSHVEGRSGLCGKIGQKIFSDKLSLRADPYDPRYEGTPFDSEGYARQAVQLIENGVVKGLAHDRRTAKSLNAENNGHATNQPNTGGPSADNIVVKEGASTVDKMVESTERGLLVTQFHYTNAIDPMALTVTGMTRAGLWLIEKGKVKQPVTNLRFSESLIKAFSNIDAIGNIAEPCGGGLFGGGMILPAMKIKDFTFSSSTEF